MIRARLSWRKASRHDTDKRRPAVYGSEDCTGVICILYVSSGLLLVICAVVSYFYDIPFSRFTRDPLAITGGHPFFGIISNVGIVLWSSSAAICFFSVLLLKKAGAGTKFLEFIMCGGFISALFLIDDLFMLHEKLLPRHLGIDQKIVYVIYGMLVVSYFLWSRIVTVASGNVFFATALFFFGVSVLTDYASSSSMPWHYQLEDGTKFIGIISWFAFHYSVCSRALLPVSCPSAPPDDQQHGPGPDSNYS